MSNLLVVKLNHRNEFRVSLTCVYDGTLINTDAKIDTGAVKSLIPLKSINYIRLVDKEVLKNFTRDSYYKMLKNEYLNNEIPYSVLRGVERVKYPDSMSILDRPDIVFSKEILDIKLDKYSILASKNVAISCNTTGNILIGMNILSNFEFYCGLSRQNNEYLFIGVLKDQEDKSDYYRALEYHFGVVTNCKDLLYYQFKDSEITKDEASGFFNWLKTHEGGK